jgi:hypothetical protein
VALIRVGHPAADANLNQNGNLVENKNAILFANPF